MTDGPQAHNRDDAPGAGRPGGPRGGAVGKARVSTTAPDLEQRIAALTAQVRVLAERFTGIRPASPLPQAASPSPGAQEPGIVREASSPVLPGASENTSAIVAAAQAAAGEIRASAEREAKLILAAAGYSPIGTVRALRDTVARQRETLAGLVAETTRIEHSAAILQAQVRALEAEMRQALAVVDALAERES